MICKRNPVVLKPISQLAKTEFHSGALFNPVWSLKMTQNDNSVITYSHSLLVMTTFKD